MKFDTPATTNPIDQVKVVGKPTDRIEGPLKTTGRRPTPMSTMTSRRTRPMAWWSVRPSPRGASLSIDLDDAKPRRACSHRHRARMPASSAKANTTPPSCSAGRRSSTTTRPSRWWWRKPSNRPAPRRSWSGVNYARAEARSISPGEAPRLGADATRRGRPDTARRRFRSGLRGAPVQLDATYTTPDQAHAMMEPHAVDGRLGRRQAHAVDLEPDDRLGRDGSGQDPRHAQGKRAADLALHRRRLRRQAVHSRRRGARGARRAQAGDGR